MWRGVCGAYDRASVSPPKTIITSIIVIINGTIIAIRLRKIAFKRVEFIEL